MPGGSCEELICDGEIIGVVTVVSSDNFTTLGTFVPGSAFAVYKHLFDDVEALHLLLEQALDENDGSLDGDRVYCAASDAWQDALERINDLKLCLRSADGRVQAIRDFQIDHNRRVEFKPDRA